MMQIKDKRKFIKFRINDSIFEDLTITTYLIKENLLVVLYKSFLSEISIDLIFIFIFYFRFVIIINIL